MEATDKNNNEQNFLKQKAPVLSSIKKQNCFLVPENYFENLFASTNSFINHSTEELFNVPLDYFDEDKTLNRIESISANKQDFIVPEGYFENLSESVIQSVVPQVNQRTVELDAGYFDELNHKVWEKINKEKNNSQKQEPLIIPLFSYRNVGIAAAASIVLFVLIYLGFENNFQKTEMVENKMPEYKIQLENINQQIKQDSEMTLATQNEIESLDLDEMIEHIDTTDYEIEMKENLVAAKEDIVDYLIENGIDDKLLLEEI